MIAGRIAIYPVLLSLFILSRSGLSPPQRLPQWLRSSRRAMDDGRRERRGPPFSPLFPLPIAPSALSFFPLPSLPTTQREESPQVTVPYLGLRWCMARKICGEGNQAIPGTNHNQTSLFFFYYYYLVLLLLLWLLLFIAIQFTIK